MSAQTVVSVVGLGYVGLPVAVAFGQKQMTIGFDVQESRVAELKQGIDRTQEHSVEELKNLQLVYTCDKNELKKANFHIICVPTPVDSSNQPDLTPLLRACETLGSVLKTGDTVVFESTVYPGATEEDCVPVLERISGLVCGKDFKVGYSPERINPADKEHTFSKTLKVVSGMDAASAELIAKTYASVVEAGVFKAASIKVAEAAKVIENTQRDLNIALVNELALIFDRLGIDTHDVLEAAGTKWNFLKFTPGLVGGHCIGVDPYYLTHKAEKCGYHPQVIQAGRRINDNMGRFIAQQTVKEMIHAGQNIKDSLVTVFGLTFKENCPDIRNSKVVDVINELQDFGVTVQVCDPVADAKEAKKEYGVDLVPLDQLKPSKGIVMAVAHQAFQEMKPGDFKKLCDTDSPVFIDVKAQLNRDALVQAGFRIWRL
ncbi:MAG: nucleotide sugar dehydrogenase [Deltaproteobacteria bacterium]|nr:nucleotide sugar dehydrogenase [Deltaproteobacteria bacterium]